MTAPGTTAEYEGTPLRRAISPRMLVLFIVGDILGAGIYALTGKVAGEVGGAIWVPFLVAFVLAALTATAYAELVGKYPQAAGAALYTHKAFRQPFVTFLVAFAVLMSGITSASAAARAFGGDYLAEFVDLPTVLVGLGFVLGLAAINYWGIRESVRINIALTLVELTGLLVILGIGLVALLSGDGEPGRAVEFDAENGALLGILGGTALAFYALLGFEDTVNLAEETHEPARSFPRALFAGLAITGLIYLGVAFVSSMMLPADELSESSGPLLAVVEAGGVDFPPKLFAAIALLAVANTALINLIMASRLLYGMARQGLVPRVLARVSDARKTPWVAILLTLGIAAVLVSTGSLTGLADTTVLLLLCVFAIVNIAVLVLRRDRVEHAHFRAPTVLPALGAVACVVLASPLTGREGSVYLRAAILLAIGVALWVIDRLVRGRAPEIDEEHIGEV
jgi:basic amino acid/polyamine antiporter, APA family